MRVTTRLNKAADKNAAADERLLAALVEHVKLPLMQIARRSELAKQDGDYLGHLEMIETTADSALHLLDSYLLSLHLAQRQGAGLEPVSVGVVLDKAAHDLSRLAKDCDTDIAVRLSGKFEPVLAHPVALEAALMSLGRVIIESRSLSKDSRPTVMLAAHRGRNGIVTGIYSDIDNLSQDMLKRGHALYGRARLALPTISADSGAGVFIADSLLGTMAARLRVSHYHSLAGLAATLASTKQLQLIS